MRKVLLFFVISALLFAFSGCGGGDSSFVSEKDEKQYQRGQKLYKEKRYRDAMMAFLKVIEKRRDAPESHLEVGRLYLEQVKDPVSAIYHFKKFLEAKPDVQQSPMVRQMIETAKKAFARSLPGNTAEPEATDRLDMMDVLKQIRSENANLKKTLAIYKNRVQKLEAGLIARSELKPKESVTFTPKPTAQLMKQDRFYTVVGGDTLSQISNKVYGASSHWQRIFTANQDVLPTPHSLKVGQTLKIPAME